MPINSNFLIDSIEFTAKVEDVKPQKSVFRKKSVFNDRMESMKLNRHQNLEDEEYFESLSQSEAGNN